jgi:hypothetical protein
MLAQVCFEQVKDQFCYGVYGPFRIVVDQADGYINATKLCSSGGKQFHHWKQSATAKRLVEALQEHLQDAGSEVLENSQHNENTLQPTPRGIPLEVCRYVQTENKDDADKLISGTYIHPYLLPSVAGWVSPKHQIQANVVLLAFNRRQNREQIVEYEGKLNNMRAELTRSQEIEGWHLDHLNVLQDVLKEKDDEMQKKDEEIIDKDVRDAMNQLLLDVCTASETEHKETIQKKVLQLDTWGNSHSLTMLRLNDATARHPLYAIRCKRSALKKTLALRRLKHPNCTIIYQNLKVPNPVNMYNRLKTSGMLIFKRNYCVSILSDAELVSKLEELYNIIQ